MGWKSTLAMPDVVLASRLGLCAATLASRAEAGPFVAGAWPWNDIRTTASAAHVMPDAERNNRFFMDSPFKMKPATMPAYQDIDVVQEKLQQVWRART